MQMPLCLLPCCCSCCHQPIDCTCADAFESAPLLLRGVPSLTGPSPSSLSARPSMLLSARPSMRRWPAAIASSSAYEQQSDLEAPLLVREGGTARAVRCAHLCNVHTSTNISCSQGPSDPGSEFQDANEAFASPSSGSGRRQGFVDFQGHAIQMKKRYRGSEENRRRRRNVHSWSGLLICAIECTV